VPLMPFTEGPSLPEWNDAMILPPSFDEYLLEKEKKAKEGND
jgi:general secretion pathway protein D